MKESQMVDTDDDDDDFFNFNVNGDKHTSMPFIIHLLNIAN